MNILLLDIDDEAVIQKLKEDKSLKVIKSTIKKPKLYPIPDVIVLNFQVVLQSERNEKVMIHIANKLHPQVIVTAYAKERDEGMQMLAQAFGADDYQVFAELDKLPKLIKFYSMLPPR